MGSAGQGLARVSGGWGAGNNGPISTAMASSFLNGPGVCCGMGWSSAWPDRSRRLPRTPAAGNAPGEDGWYGRSGTGRYGPGAARRLAMGEALTIRVRRDRGYAIVAVAGEGDNATVTRLRERLLGLAASGRTLVVDLDQVSFIDSAGLAALVGAARRAAAHGAKPAGSLRPAPDPAAVPPDGAGRPRTAGPHPR